MTIFDYLGQTLTLYPERGVFWHQEATLIVADVHFGKAAAFRASGIPLPAGTTQNNLHRLGRMIDITSARRLLILGDLLHAKRGVTREVVDQVAMWRQARSALQIDLVLGNHDQHAGRPPEAWLMHSADELVEPPFVWRHHPGESPDGYVVAGHIHPAVSLRGRGEGVTLPCFYFGQKGAILPAFGEFTGFAQVRPRRGEAVFVIADDEVIRVDAQTNR